MLETPVFLGIEIGGTKLQVVTGTGDGTIMQRQRFTIQAGCGADAIKSTLAAAIGQVRQQETIQAVGVGFGGPVNYRQGIICTSHQVSGWSGFPLGNWLEQLTGCPAAVENDANTAALAEALYGSGKGIGTVFYITIGSGIGGGLVIDGELYHGRLPGEVEVGHLRLNKNGDTLEDRCSGWSVDKKVRDAISLQPRSLLSILSATHQGHEALLLAPALDQNDKTAQTIIHDVADDLAFALSHVVHLFHPHLIVAGGGLSLLKEHLLVPLQQRLPQYLMKAFHPAPPICTALLEEDVVPIGALALAKQQFINSKKQAFPQ